jgi:hypothetical protein
MAFQELNEKTYAVIKQGLDSGLSVESVAENSGYGARRIRLVRRSKSYKSYLALRRIERQKAAENTPLKAKAGKHDLKREPIEENLGSDFIETPLVTTDKDGAVNGHIAVTTGEAMPKTDMYRAARAHSARKRQEAREFSVATAILILAAVGILSTVIAIINWLT